ncbi:MAG: deoxyribonuclease IV [Planctomycetota bacterium]
MRASRRSNAKEPLIGAHMSIAGGISRAFERGVRVGCRTIQVFVKSPTRWKAQAFTDAERERSLAEAKRTGLSPVIAHASYLINLCSIDDALWARSVEGFTEELLRADAVDADDIVLHVGSYRGADARFGVERAGTALARIVETTPAARTRIALETTAGTGSTACGRFEEIALLLAHVGRPERFGVCFDTCHVHAAGYDITSGPKLRETLRQFDQEVGPGRLTVLHLNDCRGGTGSRMDRHEHIGKGAIGLEAFRAVMREERFAAMPKIIETPKFDRKGRSMDPVNLTLLESLAQ